MEQNEKQDASGLLERIGKELATEWVFEWKDMPEGFAWTAAKEVARRYAAAHALAVGEAVRQDDINKLTDYGNTEFAVHIIKEEATTVQDIINSLK